MKSVGLVCLLAVATLAVFASGVPRKLINERSYPNGWEADMGALDLLSNALDDDVDATGIVFVYGARRGLRSDVKQRITCMENYLTQRRGVPANRIRVLSGGHRAHTMIELWVVPRGANAPTATPTVQPNNVTFIKRGSRYRCDLGPRITNRWTRAAGACFSTNLVRRRAL
jgi:hypothetical protein